MNIKVKSKKMTEHIITFKHSSTGMCLMYFEAVVDQTNNLVFKLVDMDVHNNCKEKNACLSDEHPVKISRELEHE